MGFFRRTSRRRFLTGQAAADALGELADSVAQGQQASEGDPPPAPVDTYALHVSRRAMATLFEVYLNAGQYEQGIEKAIEALDLVEELEDQLSVYRPETEISHINRTAHERPVEVERRLFALLMYALRLHAESGGAYDITAGPLSKVWGFSRRAGAVPTPVELTAARERVGSQHVELDPERGTIYFRRPGLELNLGSIGKGYTLDRCGELLEAAGIDDYLLHGGQSSVRARGNRLSPEVGDRGWLVGIADPLRPDRRLGQVWLRDRALGTSGSGAQYFHYQGRRLGHILDPRTGWPTEAVLSTTVLAPTAMEADALSTAFFIMGVDAARDYCSKRPELAALFVCPSRQGGVELVPLGLVEDDLQIGSNC